MIEYTDFSRTFDNSSEPFKMPGKVNYISMQYDGGRVCVYINDQLVYENLSAGSDFNIQIGDIA